MAETEYSEEVELEATEMMEMDKEEDAEEEHEDLFSRLGESSDNPEQQQAYHEYLALIKEIDCQNKIIEDIKAEVMEMCNKPCKTRNDMREIKRLRVCMEQENIKLHTMMNQAVKLQNFGSPRHYRDLVITTAIEDDALSPYTCTTCPIGGDVDSQSKSEQSPMEISSCSAGGGVDAGAGAGSPPDAKTMKALCKLMQKMKVCCPEDRKLIQEIAACIMGNKKGARNMTTATVCSPAPCSGHGDDSSEQGRKYKRPSVPCDPCSPCKPCSPSQSDRNSNLDKLKKRIMNMQENVKMLLQEVCKRSGGQQQEHSDETSSFTKMMHACQEADRLQEQIGQEEPDPLIVCGAKRGKTDKYEKLKENYTRLLTEFQRKDCQLKELEKRMKGMCGSCGSGGVGKGGDADAAELNLLRVRVNEMKEEQQEFKCIMKEQSQQLEDYRNKYLLAQQKVEEQCVTLEKLNMSNKRIEQQINNEVKEIRAKFQEKLNELLHFPKLLENEQLKLAQVCKEKDDLQAKLVVVCKELKILKTQASQPGFDDCRPQLAQCQLELTKAKTELEELLRQRDLFCEQLKSTQDDLDTLRTESAKIIAGTKERAELVKQQLQEQINRLEKELAQCRATATLSVNDREAVIREMQGQLNTLSYSFDSAQKQIKTLRNHIAYVSNENCFPVKC